MHDPIVTSLNSLEVKIAELIGNWRQDKAIAEGRQNLYGLSNQASRQYHIDGCYGETAVAKYLDIFWMGNGAQRDIPDVGIYQVRHCLNHYSRLILHKPDKDHEPVVCTTGRPNEIKIWGWIFASEGKNEDIWWQDPTGGNRPAFFVPHSVLRPMTVHPDTIIRPTAWGVRGAAKVTAPIMLA